MFVHPELYDSETKTPYVNAYGRINTIELHRQEGYLCVHIRWYSSKSAAGSIKDPSSIASKPLCAWSTIIPREALNLFLSGGLGVLDVPGLEQVKNPAAALYMLVAKFDNQGTDGQSRYVEQNVGSDE